MLDIDSKAAVVVSIIRKEEGKAFLGTMEISEKSCTT